MNVTNGNIERVIAAWNGQDVDAVVACYTEDCLYRDPNTRGAVEGRTGLRKYLAKLFSTWRMHWTIKEVHPFADGNGGAFLWLADLSPIGTDAKKRVHGMDLVVLRGDLIARNEVYFDRASLFT